MRSGPILQVITDNDRRGGQVFASDLQAALTSLGAEVRTVALAPASSPSGLDFELLGATRRHPGTLRALRSAIASSSVVIGHGSTTLPMCALAVAGQDVPFVYRQISEQLFWANTRGRRLRTRSALRAADHVTALWQGAAEVLVAHFGVAADDITVVPNGVPSDRCPRIDPAARRDARVRFGLDPARPTLLSIGALVPEKGVDTLVRTMREPQLDGWQLFIVGSGPERSHLEALASHLAPGTVVFHDPVPSGKDAIVAADVVGLTSRGGDSMPAVLIEAGIMGLPAVATPIEGIVDIIRDGDTGRLVAPDDVVATAHAVAEVGTRVTEFGMAARAHCLANFEITPVAARWHQVLEDVRRK